MKDLFITALALLKRKIEEKEEVLEKIKREKNIVSTQIKWEEENIGRKKEELNKLQIEKEEYNNNLKKKINKIFLSVFLLLLFLINITIHEVPLVEVLLSLKMPIIITGFTLGFSFLNRSILKKRKIKNGYSSNHTKYQSLERIEDLIIKLKQEIIYQEQNLYALKLLESNLLDKEEIENIKYTVLQEEKDDILQRYLKCLEQIEDDSMEQKLNEEYLKGMPKFDKTPIELMLKRK